MEREECRAEISEEKYIPCLYCFTQYSPSPAMMRDYLGRYLTSQEAWLFQICGETRCLHLKATH
jgi:hypothetical protein